MRRSVEKAKKQGSIVIDMAVSVHIKTNASLERIELPRLGLPSYEGLYMKLEKLKAQNIAFDYVIAMSELVKESYVQNGFPAERIFVAAPDIDTVRFSSSTKERQSMEVFRVLYVAHTQPLKGLHYLLQAWKEAQLQHAELVIVGRFTDMPKELEVRYRTQIHDDPRITWIENATNPEELYRSASVLVFPTLTEGFGRVTLEAMACGIPVITTENARGIVEDGKTGFIVPIRDAESIKEKLLYLYTHPLIAVQMGNDARKAVEHKKPFGAAVAEICQNIVAKHNL